MIVAILVTHQSVIHSSIFIWLYNIQKTLTYQTKQYVVTTLVTTPQFQEKHHTNHIIIL